MAENRRPALGQGQEIELGLVALLADENVIFLSLPGAVKTTLSRMIAQGVRLVRLDRYTGRTSARIAVQVNLTVV